MTSDVVWHRMVLTANYWGHKPWIPDYSQPQILVLFICRIVWTLDADTDIATIPSSDDDGQLTTINDPSRAPDDERPTEGR